MSDDDQPMGPESFAALQRPSREQLENEGAYFGPSTEAQSRYGVLYQGEYETLGDGTAIAVRRHARALADSGIPVLLRSFSNVVLRDGMFESAHLGIPEEVEAEIDDLRKASIGQLVPVIKHAVLTNPEQIRHTIVPHGAIGLGGDIMETVKLRKAAVDSTILYSVWERDKLTEEMVHELNRSAQLWVPCVQNADMLISSGVDAGKVHVVPHPYYEDDDILKLVRRRPQTEWRLFYSIGRWEPRKAYSELVEAFLRAFGPEDKVVLTIKYSGGQWEDYPGPEETMQRTLQRADVRARWTEEQAWQRVRLTNTHLNRSGIIELHFNNNIYVSCSHGEAWNWGAFEAKLAGNALVYVPWGGAVDYAADTDFLVSPEVQLVPVHASYRWKDARWADVTVEALIAALRRAMPPAAYKFDLARFSSEAVGRQMRALVLQVVQKQKPEAAEYYEKGSQ